MSVIETTFTTTPDTKVANVVALCDTCNELSLNPAITHTWDDNDFYTGTTTCEDCQ